jgi:acyl-CoA synthetase (AMP-forming)/AMP-acid ligase II
VLDAGDAGYLDHEGYLYICDRISETIIVGGENVYPAEVENALCAHPDVREAAVVAAPDPVSGERVHAFVVLRNGNTVTGFDLTAFIRRSLAQFKIPAVYDFIDAVPRTPSGKVLRRTLRERLWTGMTRKVN